MKNSQDNISLRESRKTITGGPEHAKIFEAQVKDLEIAIMKTVKVLQDEMNNPLKKLIKHKTV